MVVITIMVLVMEIYLYTITTQIHFAIDNLNQTGNFQNTCGNYKTKASTSLENGVSQLMPQQTDMGEKDVTSV